MFFITLLSADGGDIEIIKENVFAQDEAHHTTINAAPALSRSLAYEMISCWLLLLCGHDEDDCGQALSSSLSSRGQL
jgi:hypothetical protein